MRSESKSPMAGLKIRQAEPHDAEAMTAIAFASKRHWGYPESWMDEWRDQLTISTEFVRGHQAFLVSDEQRIVGFGAVEVNGSEALIVHLWVEPAAMNQGVGALLFGQCEAAARTAGALRLTVESDPHAEGFYLKMGARRVGEVPAPVGGEERFLPALEKLLI